MSSRATARALRYCSWRRVSSRRAFKAHCSQPRFVVPATPAGTAFQTSFTATEDPISESGKWVNGLAVGLDWNNVKTASGNAFGSSDAFYLVTRYADDIAHLSTSYRTFSPDQYVQTVAHVDAHDGGGAHESEHLLRFAITANSARGYEVMWGRTGYISIVRWNGPIADFTTIFETNLPGIGVPVDGDVLRSEIEGVGAATVIRVYKNGAEISGSPISVNIGGTIWDDGQPGLGFWPVDGSIASDYGWASYETDNL